FVQDNSSEWLTADGWRLFDAAVDYAQQSTASVDLESTTYPAFFALKQNYPNPFNPVTHIEFELSRQAMVRLDIFNVYGQLVKTLIHEERMAGVHTATWSGVDQNDAPVAGGIYYCRLTAHRSDESHALLRKMTLLK
ncbi:hypothetical protein JW998_08195, partial [candidate division KSB1 bacterium]|nr:hypothetical protein [candidate division KSB1 bacterium]